MAKTHDFAKQWFATQGWKPFAFQKEVWAAVKAGQSGLLHASTGAGKTYALWFAALNRFAITRPPATGKRKPPAEPLSVLWITPMRALAADSARALQAPLEALHIPWSVGLRTGDTSSSERARQTRRQPTALVTTPESLTLMLARADSETSLAHLRMVIVDEWHELIGNKRGVQLQLALARLRRWHPELMVWGISATLGNQAHALEVLVPQGGGVNVQGQTAKALKVDTLLPPVTERFPWAGHIGLKMLPQVVAEVEASSSCLVFTNTRAQSEIWYQAILGARPDWAGLIALHHGSLSRETRDWVERALKDGQLKAVVCTSSLDLGVDFLPVERVLVPASFGLVPHWVKSASDGRLRALKLVNAKIDNLTTGTAFRDAWLAGQRCIVPLQSFQVDDLRPGKPLPTRITRVDNQPMGAAGVWARWVGEDGEVIVSYALITINANAHALMNRYGQPGNDKAMPAILNEGAYDAWLNAKVNKAKEFLRPYPAEKLRANPVEKGRKQPPPLF
mgnify:CR=1 FL=1